MIDAIGQGSSISSPRAKSGPRKDKQLARGATPNTEEIYYILFKIHVSVLTIYLY